MKVVYVAGPLFGPNDWEIRRHIHRAASLGYEVAKLGAYPVIPHTNTGSVFIGTKTPEFWYEGTLELLRRCDAVILVLGWEDSKGSRAEFDEAKRLNMPVFTRVDELKTWLVESKKLHDDALDASACTCTPKLVHCSTCRTGEFHPRAKVHLTERIAAIVTALKGD